MVQLVTAERNGGWGFLELVNGGMYGGICVPFQPVGTSNEPQLGRASEDAPARSIAQFDIASLYPWAMSQAIPERSGAHQGLVF